MPPDEEFVVGTARRRNNAAARGAPRMPSDEGFVVGTGLFLPSPLGMKWNGRPNPPRDTMLTRMKWNGHPNPPRDTRPRSQVPSPKGVGKSTQAMCTLTQVVLLLVKRPPSLRLPWP